MSTRSVFAYLKYKRYLLSRIESAPRSGRGQRRRLAEAMEMQTSYLSQILGGEVHLSLEQADRLNHFWQHSERESRYFLLLVQHERAGTRSLKQHFKSQIDEMRKSAFNLHEEFQIGNELNEDSKRIYYSHWSYGAIHALLSIPRFSDRALLANYLCLPLSQVSEVIENLIRMGIIGLEKGRYVTRATRIHLSSSSSLIRQHHLNWRMKALDAMARNEEEDLFYSSSVSLSEEDAVKIKARLVDWLKETKQIIAASPEETGRCLSIDFFRI